MTSKETMDYLADKYICRICDAIIEEDKGDVKIAFEDGYAHYGCVEELFQDEISQEI